MKWKQVRAVLLALTLVASLGVVAGASATALNATPLQNEDESSHENESADDVEPADEVYLYENGDAVLVNEEDHDEVDSAGDGPDDVNVSNVTGEFGIDGEAGLFHLLYSADLDEESNVTGDISARATGESMAVTGDVTGEKPDDLVELSVDVESEQTRSASQSSADVRLVVENESEDLDEEELEAYQSLEAESSTEVTASTYETSGSVTAVSNVSNDADVPGADRDTSIDVTITETDGGYELEASEQRVIYDWSRGNWDTRENATESLESQYSGAAMQLGGTADVTLSEYEFDEGEDAHGVTLAYTVTFEDVEEQVAERMAEELADSEEYDLDEQEAQRITDRILELEFERVSYASETSGDETTVEWEVRINNYDEAVLGAVELSESIETVDDDLNEEYDNVSAIMAAQDEADLVRTSSMNVSYESDGPETVFEYHVRSDAENWEAFVDELEERGLADRMSETTVEFSAQTEGENVTTSFEYEAEREEWLNESLSSVLDGVENGTDTDEDREDLVEAVTAFQESQFDVARANVSLEDDTVTVRSAARFGNLSAFEKYPLETDDNVTVVDVYVETENGTSTTYVTAEAFVDEDPSEAEVREHPRVDENTTVHMPGEWDREFPGVDVESVNAYLEEDDDESLLGGLGLVAIGAGAVALIVVIGGAVAIGRL